MICSLGLLIIFLSVFVYVFKLIVLFSLYNGIIRSGWTRERYKTTNNILPSTNTDIESQSIRKRSFTSTTYKHYKRHKIGEDVTLTCNHSGQVLKENPNNGTKIPL